MDSVGLLTVPALLLKKPPHAVETQPRHHHQQGHLRTYVSTSLGTCSTSVFMQKLLNDLVFWSTAQQDCASVTAANAATLQEEAVKSTGLRSFELFLEKDRNPSGHIADTSNEEAVSVGPGLELTDGSVFSHEAAVCDDRVRVEVQQHWAEGEDGAWDGAPTQGSKCSVTRGQAVDLHPIIDTAGMC